MKNTREYTFVELGFFTEQHCEVIREKCEGTFMNIRVSWSNYAGNCTLIICSDYGTEDMTYEESEKEVKSMFLHKALTALKD